MKRITHNSLALGLIIASAIFVAAAWLAPPGVVIEFLRLFQISASLAVFFAYVPGVWRILQRTPVIEEGDHLVLGVVVGSLASFANGSWMLLWRLGGQPAWMLTSDMQALIVYGTVLSFLLLLTAPGAIDGRVPRRNWVMLGAAVGVAFFATALSLVNRPSARAIVDFLEQFMS